MEGDDMADARAAAEPFSLAAARGVRASLRADLARRAAERRTRPASEAHAALCAAVGLRASATAAAAAAAAAAGADDADALAGASPTRGDGARGGKGGREGGEDPAAAELRALVATALLADSPFDPLDSAALHRRLSSGASASRYAALGGAGVLPRALRALASGEGACLEVEEYTQRGETRLMVLDVDAPRLALAAAGGGGSSARATGGGVTAARGASAGDTAAAAAASRKRVARSTGGSAPSRGGGGGGGDELDSLLAAPSFKERQARADGAELMALLCTPTARQAAAAERFRSVGGPAVTEYCAHLTKEDCRRARPRGSAGACGCLHFVRILMPHTDVALGDCSFLDTCRHMRTCKYVHYSLDPADAHAAAGAAAAGGAGGGAGGGGSSAVVAAPRPRIAVPEALAAHPEPQWLNCDVRSFELGLLGQFGVIMADPPWDIHMDLPYGTMADDEMRHMAIGTLQSEGVMFLWVTGRAMELGRECLALWGYKFVQELLWVKTNQLQRIIRTGRTGHWLNHSKEHCLVGVKGNPKHVNAHIDCDVLVAEVRETSRKPDEMYALLERLSPGTRKLEIFGREHNTRPGWVTLGNQLPGARLHEEALRKRFLARYPDRAHELSPPAAA
jgi:mRNA (2'-O-methyladenosine-N6-)-methyltransferase